MSFEELKLMRTPFLRNSPSITLYFVLAVYMGAVWALLRGVLPDKHGKQTFSGSWAGRNSRAGRPHLDLPWGYSTSRLKVSCAIVDPDFLDGCSCCVCNLLCGIGLSGFSTCQGR